MANYNNKKQWSYEEVNELASQVAFIPIKEIDKTGRLMTGKGSIGTVIEESIFNIKTNNNHSPDFENLGLELKVTPYKKLNHKKTQAERIVAKERLICNMINYFNEVKSSDFESSLFYAKCNSMLMMFYEHIDNINKGDFKITHIRFITIDQASKDKFKVFIKLPARDIAIIKNDWNYIVQKIKAGQAHLLSEGDTLHLGAVTKAKDSSVLVDQPYNELKAKPRAYSFKQKYMTYILNNYVFQESHLADESSAKQTIIKDDNLLELHSLQSLIIESFKPYFGKRESSLAQLLNLSTKNKGWRNLLVSKILGLSVNIDQSQEFLKSGMKFKTIRVESNGKIKEHMSFEAIDWNRLATSDFYHSQVYEQLCQSKLMFRLARNYFS